MNLFNLTTEQRTYVIYGILLAIIAYLMYQLNTNDYSVDLEYFNSKIQKIPIVINIKNMQFNPNYLQVPLGQEVTWINLDNGEDQKYKPRVHDVTESRQALFKSPDLRLNQSFTQIFDRAGKYVYHCSHHPQMRGTIVVINKH